MLCGSISTFPNIVIPVPVKADMLSKTPSIIGIPVEKVKTSPPIKLAQSHAKDDIIIPCFKRMFFLAVFLKYSLKKYPKTIEIIAGTTKLTMSNSK